MQHTRTRPDQWLSPGTSPYWLHPAGSELQAATGMHQRVRASGVQHERQRTCWWTVDTRGWCRHTPASARSRQWPLPALSEASTDVPCHTALSWSRSPGILQKNHKNLYITSVLFCSWVDFSPFQVYYFLHKSIHDKMWNKTLLVLRSICYVALHHWRYTPGIK